MPTVEAKESRSDFVSRCIPIVIREGATQAHAVGKCGGIFDTHRRKVTTNRTRVVPSNPLKADPTRSATLRRVFTTNISVRFTRLKRKLQRLIVDQDAFGLTGTQNKERDNVRHDIGRSSEGIRDNSSQRSSEDIRGVDNTKREVGQTLTTNAGLGNSRERLGLSINAGRWAFQTSKRKVKLFEKWLKTQVQIDVLPGTKAKASEAYWKKYVQQGYEKGAGRAFDDVRKPALASGQEQLAFFKGTKEEFLRQSFAKPVAVRKVKLLAERVFTGLKDVTDDMSDILTQQLTEGLTQGMNPKDIARKMIKEGIGDKVRGVQSRAERIARTEIIRAHAEGQLDALEELGVTEVGVMVEWSTAGDDRVCPLCSALDSVVLTIKEARGILPRHPNCRCAYIPANVGESKKGQQRGKTEVKGAFDDSIRAERKKGSLAEKKGKSKWLGADKTIAKDRPRGVLDKPKVLRLEPIAKVIPTKRDVFPKSQIGDSRKLKTLTEDDIAEGRIGKVIPKNVQRAGDRLSDTIEAKENLLEAVQDYTNKGFRGINKSLRTEKALSASQKTTVKVLDDLTNRTLGASTTTYRTVGKSASKWEELAEGILREGRGTILEKGFASTSIDPGVVSRLTPKKGKKVLLQIRTSKGAYVAPVSEVPAEFELILPRNTRFNVLGIDKNVTIGAEKTKYTIIRLEVQSSPAQPTGSLVKLPKSKLRKKI